MNKFWNYVNKIDQPDGWSILQAATFLLVLSPLLYIIWITITLAP